VENQLPDVNDLAPIWKTSHGVAQGRGENVAGVHLG
jgi:hypothetical protein